MYIASPFMFFKWNIDAWGDNNSVCFPIKAFVSDLRSARLFRFYVAVRTVSTFSFRYNSPRPTRNVRGPFNFVFRFLGKNFPNNACDVSGTSTAFRSTRVAITIRPPSRFIKTGSSRGRVNVEIGRSQRRCVPSNIGRFVTKLFVTCAIFTGVNGGTINCSCHSTEGIRGFIRNFSFPNNSTLQDGSINVSSGRIITRDY